MEPSLALGSPPWRRLPRSPSALLPHAEPPDRLVITDEAGYLNCPAGLSKSKLASALLGKGGREVTTRNWATVLKLAALIDAA